MSLKLPDSPALKQAIGAVAGMALAGMLYVANSQVSYRAMIVDMDNAAITGNAGDVRVNSTNVDDRTLARLQTRAQEVARLQEESAKQPAVPKTQPEQNADRRLEERKTMIARLNAATHVVVENEWVEPDERSRLRAERAIALQKGESVAVTDDASKTAVMYGDEEPVTAEHAGADRAMIQKARQAQVPAPSKAPSSTRLANSGPGTGFIALLAVTMAGFVLHRYDVVRRIEAITRVART